MKKFHENWVEFERVISGILLLLVTIGGLVQVMARYVLGGSIRWGDDFILFCMVWFVFIGSSVAVVEKKHIIVSVLVDAFPKKIAKVLTIAAQVAWCALVALTMYITCMHAIDTAQKGSVAINSGFPYWIALISMPIGMALMLVKVVLLIVKTIQGERDTLTDEEIIKEEMEK